MAFFCLTRVALNQSTKKSQVHEVGCWLVLLRKKRKSFFSMLCASFADALIPMAGRLVREAQ